MIKKDNIIVIFKVIIFILLQMYCLYEISHFTLDEFLFSGPFLWRVRVGSLFFFIYSFFNMVINIKKIVDTLKDNS